MQEAGQVEGRTYRLHVRYARGDPARFPALLRESIAQDPAVLVVVGLLGARAAREATTTIPVVVATGSDLVDAGIVESYARPGGNVTGVSDLTDESAAKRLELVRAALPRASRVALLVNPDFPATPKIEARVEAMARTLGISITRLYARDHASLLVAFDSLSTSRPDALLVGGDPVAVAFAGEMVDRALALRVPLFHFWPGSTEHGALASLQVDIDDNYRRAAGYVDRILKGAKPAEMPIEQPTRYALLVNLKTAEKLGIAVPQALLLRADRVIR
jgi:putative ABC transport system substrate-binding protein